MGMMSRRGRRSYDRHNCKMHLAQAKSNIIEVDTLQGAETCSGPLRARENYCFLVEMSTPPSLLPMIRRGFFGSIHRSW